MSASRIIASLLPRVPRITRAARPAAAAATLFRAYHATPVLLRKDSGWRRGEAPITRDGIAPTYEEDAPAQNPSEETPQDALSTLNVYGDVPAPGSAVETIYDDGFVFSNGVKFYDGSGALLVHNEVLKWRPAERGSEIEKKAVKTGILELGEDVWGMLDVVHPKPGTFAHARASGPLTGRCRTADHRHREEDAAAVAGRSEQDHRDGNADGCDGHEQRGSTVQSFGDRAVDARSRRRIDGGGVRVAIDAGADLVLLVRTVMNLGQKPPVCPYFGVLLAHVPSSTTMIITPIELVC